MADEEARFHWSEKFAAVWSAAAFSRIAVNRPAEWGWWGRLSGSACVTEVRSGIPSRTFEVFSQEVAPISGLYWQDVVTGEQAVPGEPLTSAGTLLRSRKLPPCRGWDQVIVVGGRIPGHPCGSSLSTRDRQRPHREFHGPQFCHCQLGDPSG